MIEATVTSTQLIQAGLAFLIVTFSAALFFYSGYVVGRLRKIGR